MDDEIIIKHDWVIEKMENKQKMFRSIIALKIYNQSLFCKNDSKLIIRKINNFSNLACYFLQFALQFDLIFIE
jgi:hypothetical protein